MAEPLRLASIPSSASVVLLATIGWLGPRPTIAPAGPPTGQWLIDHGRHTGLTSDGTDVRGDAEMILIWMLASARLSPDHPDAYWWQYDLAARLGRTQAAHAALRKYLELQPDDAVARLAHIDLSINEMQTANRRIEFCIGALADAAYPEVIGDLHRRLARIYRGRGDDELARTHAMDALRACPRGDAHLLGPDAAPETRVAAMISRIAASPADVRYLWDLALLLDSLSMHGQARPWYQHALDAFHAGLQPGQPPSSLLLDLATSAMDAGDFTLAVDTCKRIPQSDPAYLDSLSIVIRSLRRSGDQDKTDAVLAELRRLLRAVPLPQLQTDADGASEPRAPATGRQQATPEMLARVAWLHTEFDPDPTRSADFSSVAMAMAPNHPFIRRAYGISRLANNDFDEAKRALTPLAPADQWAADGLAEVLLREGQRTRAVAILRQAESVRHSGVAYRRIVQRLNSLDEQPAAVPDRSALADLLDGFDERILRFAANPAEFLTLAVRMEPADVRYGDPFTSTVTLTNSGPFPITIGDGRMVTPRLLVSMQLHHSGDESADRRDRYLTISLAKRLLLKPNESVTTTQTLDVGAAEELAYAYSNEACRYTLSFLLDPVEGADGRWLSRLRGFKPALATLTRTASQPARPQSQVLNALGHASPIVRARSLYALSHEQLDESTIAGVAPVLSDTHWLVRLVAVDFFATRQGRVFSQVLARLARDDPDALVRRLASLQLSKLGRGQGASTRPGATAR